MGKNVTTPSLLLLNSDKVSLISAEFIWGSQPSENICRVNYSIHNNDRTENIRTIIFDITEADFTALVNGYGATMESRLETDVWQDIQDKFDLVP